MSSYYRVEEIKSEKTIKRQLILEELKKENAE